MNVLTLCRRHFSLRTLAQVGFALGLLFSLTLPASGSDLRFENLLDRQSDVPGNSVLSMVQDKQGFIWMGTQSGVYRHDGLHSTVFRNDPTDPTSLPGDYVSVIFRDQRDQLWFGTNNGIARFNPETASFTRYRPPAAAASNTEYVRAIIDDGHGGLWLGTARNLQHLDGASGRFTVYQHDDANQNSLGSQQVYALARDARGGLWVGAWPVGIDYLAPGSERFQHYRLDDTPAADPRENSVHALVFDRQQRLWIGTAKGVQRWQPERPWHTRQRLPGPAGNDDYSVYSIYQDHQARIWVGTQPAGLLRWDEASGQFSSYRHHAEDPYSLPSNRIPSILLDRSDTLWVGSWDNGVSRVDLASRGLEQYIPDASDGGAARQGKVIGSLSLAGDGKLWLGGPDGLRLYDSHQRTIVRAYRHDAGAPGSLPNNYVLTVLQQEHGPLWIGTTTGLDRLDRPDGPFRSYRFPDSATNFIRKIIPSRQAPGALWLATDGALLHFAPEAAAGARLRSYRHDPADPASRSSDTAGALLEDRRGRLWVGSPYGFGLDVRDPVSGQFAHYRHRDGDASTLSNDFTNCLFEDSKGRLWIGTANGLNELLQEADGKLRFRRHLIQPGQSANAVFAIEEDGAGQLWLSATGGVVRFDPASGKMTRYTASDGLTSGNFVSDAVLKDGDGTIYFGSFRGVSIIRPQLVRSNTIAAEVSITDLRVRNRSLNELPRGAQINLEGAVTNPRHLTLGWSDAMFAIEFAAMHFSDPQKNLYAYRLEGFDRDWIYADATHRVATYTNLDPGNYTFHLIAANKNGIWSATPLKLPITILTPFWLTWWFRLLCAGAAGGTLMLAYRWRIAHLQRRQHDLESLVRVRTDELAGKNTALTEANQALQQMSLTDPLTGLQNRRFLEQHMPDDAGLILRRYEGAEAGHQHDAAILFYLIDLDHFKTVNDRYGHAGGDQILLQIRERLEQVFRATDYLVRWGGEEFLIVARDTNPAHASEIAARVQAAIAGRAFRLDDEVQVQQNCSVGYACFPFSPAQPKLLSWQEVLKLADLAMYAGKRSGRAAWVGIACGSTPISDDQVRAMLSAPGAALQAGQLRVEASVCQAALLAAWHTLPDA